MDLWRNSRRYPEASPRTGMVDGEWEKNQRKLAVIPDNK
jgi:hypothetical protein